MINRAEWSFLSSNVEVNISGKKIMQNLGSKGAGLYYKFNGNDIEICIYVLAREFNYSIKSDISSIFWNFYKNGKFTIISKKNIYFFFSNTLSSSIYYFIKKIATIAPRCLSPDFNSSNYLICKSSSSTYSNSFIDYSTNLQITKKQKIVKLEQINHQDVRNVSENDFKDENYKTSSKNDLNDHQTILGDFLTNLPEDLIFYVLSMLVNPIKSERNEKSCTNYISFYKDDLIKSTNLAFVNKKLLKFFQMNVWEVSINRKMHKDSNRINYENLRSLLISNKYIRDSNIREFASSKNLPILINKLSIKGNNNITDSALTLLLLRLKNLESLEIIDCNNITGDSSFRIIGTKSSVKYLKVGSGIKQNFSISDNSLKDLFNTNSTIIDSSKKSSILYLELLNCIRITKIPIVKECHFNIEYLDLRGCRNIMSYEFERLFGYLSNLKVLILSNTNINDQILDIVFERCSDIEILDISHCTNISEKVFDKIPDKLKSISGLKSSYCMNLRTNSLIRILTGCKCLEMIDLTGCCNINNDLINYHNTMAFTSKIRKIGVFRLSLDPRKLNDMISNNMEIYSNEKINIEIRSDRELLISEFTFKYKNMRDQYLERSKPIWMN